MSGREIKCKQCGKITLKQIRDAKYFCDRTCYMNWKREHPNKKPHKEKVLISGYYYIYRPDHPLAIKNGRYIAEHRLVAEQKIGRYLQQMEVVHHINGITTDNRLENVEVMDSRDHNTLTAMARGREKDGKFKVKISCMGQGF